MEREFAKQEEWNRSYAAGDNVLFYPHEEIVRFLNQYVRKRTGMTEFTNVMQLTDTEWECFQSLDLGCGTGRHMKLLDEFGLHPYGIDLSDTAVELGRLWFTSLNRPDLAAHMMVGSATALPYEDGTFQICVSHGTLDSMPKKAAEQALREALRVLKKDGMMYFDLILDPDGTDREEIVTTAHENGTVQSYFTIESIKDWIGSLAGEGRSCRMMDCKIITWSDMYGKERNRRAHIMIRRG